MRKTKFFKKLFVAGFVVAACSILGNAPEQAKATTVTTLKQDKVYKNYDVNADGKKDTVQVKCEQEKEAGPYDGYSKYSLIVNGKTVLKKKYSYFYDAKLKIFKDKGHGYILVSIRGDNDDEDNTLYECKGSTVIKRADLTTMPYRAAYHANISSFKVTSGKIKVKYCVMSNCLASAHYTAIYKINSNGTVTLPSKVFKLSYTNVRITESDVYKSSWLVAERRIQAYKKANTANKSFVIKKGTRLKASKISFGKKVMLYFKTEDGKTGWLVSEGYSSVYESQLFKDMPFAG